MSRKRHFFVFDVHNKTISFIMEADVSKTAKIIKIIFLSITGYGIVEHLWGLDAVGLINSLSYFTMLSNIYCFIALFFV